MTMASSHDSRGELFDRESEISGFKTTVTMPMEVRSTFETPGSPQKNEVGPSLEIGEVASRERCGRNDLGRACEAASERESHWGRNYPGGGCEALSE